MIKEFVPEMRSDKKDAEIARLREQVKMLRTTLGFYSNERNYEEICDTVDYGSTTAQLPSGTCHVMEDYGQAATHALAATEEK